MIWSRQQLLQCRKTVAEFPEQNTVEPRYNDPRYNDILDITMNILLCLGKSYSNTVKCMGQNLDITSLDITIFSI